MMNAKHRSSRKNANPPVAETPGLSPARRGISPGKTGQLTMADLRALALGGPCAGQGRRRD
jgi:hypothetical protein